MAPGAALKCRSAHHGSPRIADTLRYSASSLLNRLLARGKFRHIQLLLKLAELGSVQRTAAAIGMTQSSVTQSLAYLEQLLETELFERHARGVRPTPACADLLPVARQVLAGVTEGAELLAARQNQGQGSVRLMASAAAIHGLLLRVLPRFGQQFPAIQVHLTEAEGEDQLLALSRGEVDLVVCRERPVVPEGWKFQPLVQDRLAIVCGAHHPLARRRKLRWESLAKQTWLLSPAGSIARERFDELSQRFAAAAPTHPLVTRAPAVFGWLLHHEPVLALLPVTMVQHLIDSGAVVELAISEDMPLAPIGLLRPAAGEVPAAAELAWYLASGFAPPPARPRR